MGPILNRKWFNLLALLFYCVSVCLAHSEQDNKRIERRLRNIEDSIAEERLQRREDVKNVLDKLTGLKDILTKAFGEDQQANPKLNKKDEDWIVDKRVTKILGSLAHAFSREKKIHLRFRREMEEMIKHKNNECSTIPDIIDTLDIMEGRINDIVNTVKGVVKYTDMAAEHFATKADLSEATKTITNGQMRMSENVSEKARQSQNLTEMQNAVLGRLESSLLNISSCKTNMRKVISENEDGSPMNEEIFGSCSEFYKAGFTTSGVYKLSVKDRVIDVYCDQTTDGGGWIVFQRRQDGSENFNRNWYDFKHGFGDLKGEFWLGNENLADMTDTCCRELRIEISDFAGNSVYAKYNDFSVLPESSLYQLKVGSYTGNAGDAMYNHNNMKFSTKDSDNDRSIGSACTEQYPGGWWHNTCYRAHLNGNYHRGGSRESRGLHWLDWNRYYGLLYSLKFSEMKFR